MRALLAGAFRVPAQRTRAGKGCLRLAFHPLGAGAELSNGAAAASRAVFGHLAAVIAGMALQILAVAVKGQGQVAARAAQRGAAFAAEHIGGGAAPVEKQDRLLAGFQYACKRFAQNTAEDGAVAGFQLLAHVHHIHRRQR